MESVATEPEPVSATYHVFISHRGPDVKRTLASSIYRRLTNCHGLRVFLDQKELQTGDALSPAILGAIESASVHIAIFSKRYAESRWCLDELCCILRCKRKIIPVFYDVEPTDLRYIDSERGCYRKTFEEHQLKGRVGMEDIKKWKAALNKASEISGLLFKTNESDYGEVLEEIVKAVLKGVNWEPLEVGKYLVGLDPTVREIDDEIKKQRELNGTVIVGIAGMAGVGKSTLVTHLYNLKRSAFTRFCFLSDVRKKDLSSLQRKLLRDLLGCDFHVEDTRHGKGIFRDRLRGLQVLIVLDDVDHITQISNLLVTDVVGSSSLILITSRDQDLLRRSSPKTVVYNLKPLQTEHAQELFCRHAFDQSEPYEGFECLVAEVLKICGGLPLSLQVLGGLFLGRYEEKYWKRQLERLSRRLPEDIVDTLKVSYEALNSEEKEIFLDIGCFLVGEEKEVAVRVFEGLGYTDVCDCLENLRQKCLVEFDDEVQDDEMVSRPKLDGFRIQSSQAYPDYDPDCIYDYVHLPKTEKITMHEHIRQLARHIAREEFGVLPTRDPLRLGCSKDVEELMLKLQGGADSCLIRGIRTPKGEHLPDCTNYIKGVAVRLFVVEVPIDLSTFFGMWDMSGDLVWLRLRSFSSIYFPDTVSLGNLRVLELEGRGDLEQFFQRFNMPPRNLSVLNIDVEDTHPRPRPSFNPPVHLTGTHSQRLSRGRAHQMPRRNNRVKSGASTSSSNLDLNDSAMVSNCSREGLTASYFFRFLEWMGTSIKNPSKIVLKNITFLQSLPIGFGELKSLKHLDLSGCNNLTQLPESFSELMHLQFLALRNCGNLSIPIDFLGNMSSLEYVDFEGCHKLKYLPAGIENQKSLRYLNVLSTHLKLPMNLKLPEKLQKLRIGKLEVLIVQAQSSLSIVQAHSSVSITHSSLSITHSSLSITHSSAPIDDLKGTELRQSLGDLRTELRQSLGDLRRLKELKELILIGFRDEELELILWKEIAGPNMEVLFIRNCPIKIFSFEKGTMQVGTVLRDFTLSGTEITKIHIPGHVLPSLDTLDLSGNGELKEVQNLPSTLVRLNLQGCSLLKTITSLSNLVDLKVLEANRCSVLETLNVEGLTSLEEIQAEACWELKSIQGLSQRDQLKCLRLSTKTRAIWNDICNFLASTSHENLSTAFLSGTVGKSMPTYPRLNEASTSHENLSTAFLSGTVGKLMPAYPRLNEVMREIHSIAGKFNLRVVDVDFAGYDFAGYSSEFNTKMEEFQSYGATLMCFLTVLSDLRCKIRIPWRKDLFDVRFEASDDGVSVDEFKMVVEYPPSGGFSEPELYFHILMWTEECNLFSADKGYNNICVSHRSHWGKVAGGWMMMVDKDTKVSQVCKEIIMALS